MTRAGRPLFKICRVSRIEENDHIEVSENLESSGSVRRPRRSPFLRQLILNFSVSAGHERDEIVDYRLDLLNFGFPPT